MNICLVNDFHSKNSPGGAEIIAETLARELADLGNQVSLITFDSLDSVEDQHGVKQYTVSCRYERFSSIYNREVAVKVRQVLKVVRPEIVHFHNIHNAFGYGIVRVVDELDIVSIFTAHDSMALVGGKLDRFRVSRSSGLPNVDYTIPWWFRLKRWASSSDYRRSLVSRRLLGLCQGRYAVSHALASAFSINGMP